MPKNYDKSKGKSLFRIKSIDPDALPDEALVREGAKGGYRAE
jgi:hypothetical protein